MGDAAGVAADGAEVAATGRRASVEGCGDGVAEACALAGVSELLLRCKPMTIDNTKIVAPNNRTTTQGRREARALVGWGVGAVCLP